LQLWFELLRRTVAPNSDQHLARLSPADTRCVLTHGPSLDFAVAGHGPAEMMALCLSCPLPVLLRRTASGATHHVSHRTVSLQTRLMSSLPWMLIAGERGQITEPTASAAGLVTCSQEQQPQRIPARASVRSHQEAAC